MAESETKLIDPQVLALWRCPVTRSELVQDGNYLVATKPEGAGLRYPIRDAIPVLLMDQAELPEGVESLEAFKAKYADEIT